MHDKNKASLISRFLAILFCLHAFINTVFIFKLNLIYYIVRQC